jgi:hypothetical protein
MATEENLKRVSVALLAVHRALLDHTRGEYASRFGHSLSAGEALRAAMQDPFFAWLRPLSGLIVDVDELAASREGVSEPLATGVRWEVERMLEGEAAPEFGQRYRALLQELPDLVSDHGRLRQVLRELPSPEGREDFVMRSEWPSRERPPR